MADGGTHEYQKIIDYLGGKIATGELGVGEKVPSENELAEQFGVARMTANRAVRELVHRKVLVRVKGAGSYVAPRRYDQTPVEILPISEQVRNGGAIYSASVRILEERPLISEVAESMHAKPGSRTFYSEILHREDSIPIQLERRWVNPKVAPAYLEQDFLVETPTEYLIRMVPLTRVEYCISAERASADLIEILQLRAGEPVLLLRRKTWSGLDVVTMVDLLHPGSRFSFSGFFESGLAGERVG